MKTVKTQAIKINKGMTIFKFISFLDYFTQVLGKLIGQRFVMTNPAFDTPIELNDQILVIGNLMIDK